MKNLSDINIEKSRSGVYKDTSENRRLHRVGQRYGSSRSDPKPEFVLRGKIDPVNDKDWEKKASEIDWKHADMASVGQTVAYLGKVDNSERPYAVRYYSPNGKNSDVMRLTEADYKRNLERDRKLQASRSGSEDNKSSLPTKEALKSSGDGSSIVIRNAQTGNTVISYTKKEGQWFSRNSMTRGEVKSTPDQMVRTLEGYNRKTYSIKSDLKDNGEFEGVKTVVNDMPTPPDPFVYSDNGSRDLEKQGKTGFSVWVGFKHTDRGRQPVNEAKMDGFARTVAAQQFVETVNKKLGTDFSIKDVSVENHWKNTDFFRLFIPVSSKETTKGFDVTSETFDSVMESIADKFFDSKVSGKEKRNFIEKYTGAGSYDKIWDKLNSRRFDSSTDKDNAFMEEVQNILMDKLSEKKPQEKPEQKPVEKPSSDEGTFTRVSFLDMPNSGKVNLKKYLSDKRKKAVDDAWKDAKMEGARLDAFQAMYNGLRDNFNNNFDSMSKAERAELLYKIMKIKNAMERESASEAKVPQKKVSSGVDERLNVSPMSDPVKYSENARNSVEKKNLVKILRSVGKPVKEQETETGTYGIYKVGNSYIQVVGSDVTTGMKKETSKNRFLGMPGHKRWYGGGESFNKTDKSETFSVYDSEKLNMLIEKLKERK